MSLFRLIKVLPHYCYNTILMSESAKLVIFSQMTGWCWTGFHCVQAGMGLLVCLCMWGCACKCEALDRGEVVCEGSIWRLADHSTIAA